MPEDLRWELDVLETVHQFDAELLKQSLGAQVPIPIGLDPISLRQAELSSTVALMRTWLKLLDMAISVAMIRDKLNASSEQEAAEALLLYFAKKKSPSDLDRDKTDFIATYLYRKPRVPGQWETHGFSLDGIVPIPPFEIALIEILSEVQMDVLPEEHVQALREFEQLKEDVAALANFDALMDSGIIQRVRELKSALGTSFYHPHVLATIAPYNAAFGERFDQLFREAAQQIKHFAEEVQEAGESAQTRVDVNVTVKQLSEIQRTDLLTTEYRAAQEQFHHVSKMKKAVEKRRAANDAPPHTEPATTPQRVTATAPPAVPVVAPAAPSIPATASAPLPAPRPAPSVLPPGAPPLPQPMPRVQQPAPPTPAAAAPPSTLEPPRAGLRPPQPMPGTVQQQPTELISMAVNPNQAKGALAMEESKLRAVEDSIRMFVRAADPKFRQIVPMRNGNFTLTPAEADAYCADHLEEKSFRADNARVLVKTVAVSARMVAEIQEFRNKQSSTYLWKPHADSLTYLLQQVEQLASDAAPVVALAQQRGLEQKVVTLNASINRLRERATEVIQALESINTRTSPL